MTARALAPAPEPASSDGTRFRGINALRGGAAVSVLAFHATLVAPLGNNLAAASVDQLRNGVTLFFVISGFLLFRPFAVALESGGTVDVFGYLRSRALRILPLFIFVAVTVFLVDGSVRSLRFLLPALTFTDVYRGDIVIGINPVSWSLDDEVVFYALLPIIFVAVVTLAPPRARLRAATLVTAILGTAALVYYAVLIHLIAEGSLKPFSGAAFTLLRPRNVLGKFDLFALGMVLAVAYVKLPRRIWSSRQIGILIAVALCGGVVGATLQDRRPEVVDIVYGVASTALLSAVVLAPADSRFARVVTSRSLVFLGEISYGIYLWNWPIVELVSHLRIFGRSYPGAVLTCFLITAALSTATYLVIERPFLKRKHPWALGPHVARGTRSPHPARQ